jgi:formamidopyrimidine-DNA glycosylase
MPELPEVETIRRDLEERLPGKKIKEVEIHKERMVKGISPQQLAKELAGKEVKHLRREGKIVIIELKEEKYLLIHLKMTGQLIYEDKKETVAGGHSREEETLEEAVGGELPNKYTHVIFEFQDGGCLYFNDLRQFGYIKLIEAKELEKIREDQGVDPLAEEFDAEYLADVLKKRSTEIKKVLMDQKVIAGIGNIYADEILFDAGVRPDRSASNVSDQEIEEIVDSAKKILKKAIEYRGTTFSNYTDGKGNKGNFSSKLRVYGREEGEECYKCGGTIRAIKINNRGTKYCEECQK